MALKHALRSAVRGLGYDVIRFPPLSDALATRKRLLTHYGIDVVIDVGANTGQFAGELRKLIRYPHRIVSLEPMRAAFAVLAEQARSDPFWQVLNYGLGDASEMRSINVAANSVSSSLLPMLPSHLAAAPESAYTACETIEIRTLDSVFGELSPGGGSVYLKVDTQGYESRVIAGAARSLDLIDTIQLEMSFAPLYDGELCFHEMSERLADLGYSLVSLAPSFVEPRTERLLQVDGIFHRFRSRAK